MEKLIISDRYRALFTRHGLTDLSDFFSFNNGRIINRNSRRQVSVLELEGQTFFMKSFYKPHLKDIVSSFKALGKPASIAGLEYFATKKLLDNHIETYHPAAFGQELNCGIEKRSFIMTKKLHADCLNDFCNLNWQNLSNRKKHNFVTQMALFAKKIHHHDISLPDLYTHHIFLNPDGQMKNFQFAVIDLHRMTRSRSLKEKAHNLAALLFTMIPQFFPNELKEEFLKAYSDDQPVAKIRNLIERQINKLKNRRADPLKTWRINSNAELPGNLLRA